MSILQDKYKQEIAPALKEKFSYSSSMQIPRFEKVVLNVGMASAESNPKSLEVALTEMQKISGQRPVKTYARKSIAGFKLREGMPLGCMVTLRGERMFEFLERLIQIALPRVRDFRGVSPNSFDGRGNYNLSIKEQIIFPEIDVNKVENYHGMNITVVTSAPNDEEARELLMHVGMPFRKKKSA